MIHIIVILNYLMFLISKCFALQEFNLIERRELAPLQELIEKLTAKDAR